MIILSSESLDYEEEISSIEYLKEFEDITEYFLSSFFYFLPPFDSFEILDELIDFKEISKLEISFISVLLSDS